MKKRSLLHQTAVLSLANFLVRTLGFVMRILFSRLLGAQAVGIMELSSSVQMLLITPVTSGVPMAVSRIVAQKTDAPQRRGILRAALILSFALSFLLAFITLPFLPHIARILGDVRTFPALLVALPCVPVLALSAALNGYHYGCGSTLAPALSELLEQLIRFALTIALLLAFTQTSLAMRAALPALGTLGGEIAGLLLLLIVTLPTLIKPARIERGVCRTLLRLACPMTAMRLFSTAMRTINAVMIPSRLIRSGLSMSEATTLLGMLNGMAMPLIMTPSFLTGALAMVTAPAMAQRQSCARALRRLTLKTLRIALLICVCCAVGLFVFSDFLSITLYRQRELAPLLRFLCPLLPVMGVSQVVSAMLAGLGLQRHALYASIAGNGFSLAGIYLLAVQPSLRLYGCAFSMILGQLVTLLFNLSTLKKGVLSTAA